jgi:membrane-associated phospholipid phosphatase
MTSGRSSCHHRGMRLLTIAFLFSLLTGCGSLPNGRGWGQDATFTPGWERIKTSAANAARDPWVWAPLAGALVFQIDDWDGRTASWAQEHTPVFGSQRSAEDWSDDLRTASAVAHYATLAATPSSGSPEEWLVNKAKGTLVHVAAVSSTVLVTQTLKTTIDRERPNGQGGESFPSGHTSTSAVHTRLASRNLESIAMNDVARTTLDVGLYALTIGTSWSRIEAGWHYPSDTLVGMAIGNFLASFFNDAFLGLEAESTQITVAPTERGALLQIGFRF